MSAPLLFENLASEPTSDSGSVNGGEGDGGGGGSRGETRDFWWDDAVAIENHDSFRALQRRHDSLVDQQRNVDHMYAGKHWPCVADLSPARRLTVSPAIVYTPDGSGSCLLDPEFHHPGQR